MKETLVLKEEELDMLAEKVATILSSKVKETASIVLLEGDLGAGKTTFTKALASHLGIDRESVHSPTFILKKEYRAPHHKWKRMVHVDAYRFTHPNESRALRLDDDIKEADSIIVVEWPSRMKYLKSDIEVSFSVADDTTREVTITYDER